MDNIPRSAEEYRQWWAEQKPDIPYGLCHCGCRQKTAVSDRNHAKRWWFKGEPKRYLIGHSNSKHVVRKVLYELEDRGYTTPCWIWVRRFGKNGYPLIRIPQSRHYPAHRYYHEQRYGPMPPAYITHHLCMVHECINPEHTISMSKGDHRVIHAILNMNTEKAQAISILKAGGFGIEAICRLFNLSRPVVEAIPKTDGC